MSKGKILHITHAYYNKGGVEEHVRDLTNCLRNFFDSYVLTPVRTGSFQHYQLLKEGIIKSTYAGNYIPAPVCPFRDNAAVFAFNEVIKKIRPNVIHVHHLQNWPLELLSHICQTQIPVVMTVHDYFLATPLFTMEFSDHPRELLTKEYATKIFGSDISEYLVKRRELLTQYINMVRHLITPSRSTKNEMVKIIPSEYTVIPHGIRTFFKRKKYSSNALRFGFVGSIIRQKGWRTLIKAFEKASRRHEAIELHIFGGGYEANEIAESKNIVYHQSYTKKDLPEIFSHIDVGVIPSLFKETFCYTKAEMQYAGLPLIVANIGALPEDISVQNGMTFDPGNSDDLANKISDMTEKYHSQKWDIPIPRSIEEMGADYQQLYTSLT